jgi:protein gp37
MGERSKIQWTDHTFNPWLGCAKISPGCDHCYAEVWAKRSGLVEWGGPRRRTSPATWREPIKLHAAVPEGQRERVFCASLADVFDNEVPQQWRQDLFDLISVTPRFDWLLLTKRIGNVKSMVPWYSYRGSIEPQYHFPDNVWLGISVVNQEEADRDIPKLLALPARVRFLSCEPLLGPIDLERGGFTFLRRQKSPTGIQHEAVDWVIVGGESGAHARPMEQSWAIDLVRDCRANGVPVFFKQGSKANWPRFKNFDGFPKSLQVREWPTL